MRRGSVRGITWRLALGLAATLLLANAAGARPWSAPGPPQDTAEVTKGEPAPFAGVLYTLEAEAVLLSRVENLEAAVAEYETAIAELEGERDGLREALFDLQVADAIAAGLAESRAEDLRRCESSLTAQRWISRGIGAACGFVLLLRPSLTNPVPR